MIQARQSVKMQDCADSMSKAVSYMLREVRRAVLPRMNLVDVMRDWSTIMKGLNDPRRKRMRQHEVLLDAIESIDA